MKTLLKVVVVCALGAIALFWLVANFSAVESRFQCDGQVAVQGKRQPMTLYMKLEEYRPWVRLWSDSDASLNLEAPSQWVDYYEHLEAIGDQLQIYETYPQKALRGNFSRLSKTLALDLKVGGLFDGECKTMN
ncbi:hypothetical protein [Mesorhizobium sp. WSM4884]|uniref:hypothetical protein n=1 Tax=Mesorhizobium sp. WSM4884 TaxID=3038542 RepID=UPI0024161860|nr:hypothetical protein [Mesorhizobium sp. WSM4884]MDG4885349.1 hypothetical protein [Mesorhizobium sp. WSM4884]